MRGFLIYAKSSIRYVGRATSTLDPGNYLIIIKPDGSVQIHDSCLVKPKNYMSKASVSIDDSEIIATTKSESITITIIDLYFKMALNDWDTTALNLQKSEKELVEKIVKDISVLGDNLDDFKISLEHRTKYGPIDILLIGEKMIVVEVKRKRATLNAVYQLIRYMDCIEGAVDGIIAAPSISSNAEDRCKELGIKFAVVDFD